MTLKRLPPPPQSNKKVQEYVQAIEKGLNSYYVVPNGKGWYVRKASIRTGKGTLFSSKSEAVNNAKARASRRKSRVFIFDQEGTLLSQ